MTRSNEPKERSRQWCSATMRSGSRFLFPPRTTMFPPSASRSRSFRATPGSSTNSVSVSLPSRMSVFGTNTCSPPSPICLSSFRLSKSLLVSLWIRAISSVGPIVFCISDPRLLALHQAAQLVHELVDVVELPVDRREPHVSDLVQLAQAIHHPLADDARLDLPVRALL